MSDADQHGAIVTIAIENWPPTGGFPRKNRIL
jgi:hypothetical protein